MKIEWNKVTKFSQIIAIILFVAVFFVGFTIGKEFEKKSPSNIAPIVSEKSIMGCYIAHLANDVYTLTIFSEKDGSFEGYLDIQNSEKDSSFGILEGTYKNRILLADYTFLSEGTMSVNQVIFKKIGNDFIRGYGKPDDATGTHFVDLSKITYDPSVVYKASSNGCASSN